MLLVLLLLYGHNWVICTLIMVESGLEQALLLREHGLVNNMRLNLIFLDELLHIKDWWIDEVYPLHPLLVSNVREIHNFVDLFVQK